MSENQRQGESWDVCQDCGTPYVMKDLEALPSPWRFQPTRYVCRWHAARRRERATA